jgi:hypothetical protein
MPRPTIDYLNARRDAKGATGGTTYSRECKHAPDHELDCWEYIEQQTASKWSDLAINSQAYWDRVFAQFGLVQGHDLEETF